ncbi:hypothetical protein [Kineococcus terrestris]|uniref:hypothetical protein n=1 Tax=Kineococcus terrestris TaxID=2044856 RepID=UPI0034DAE49C
MSLHVTARAGASTRRGPLLTALVAVPALLAPALAWALAATSAGAVRAGETAALGPEHTPDLPGGGELSLAAHDVRLAALVALWCALALLLAPAAGTRARPRGSVAAWVGGGLALAVANALLGPVVDGRSPALAAGLLLAAAALGALAAAGAGAALPGGPRAARAAGTARPDGTGHRWWWLTAAGALAAATAPLLALQGLSTPAWSPYVPAGLRASATLVTAALLLTAAACAATRPSGRTAGTPAPAPGVRAACVLVPVAVAALLLLDPVALRLREQAWVAGPALVAALAPLVLLTGPGRREPSRRRVRTSAVVLAGLAAAAVPALPALGLVVVVGGFGGLLVTGPAGAVVGYDGLPLTGGGVLLAAGALAVLAGLTADPAARR